MKPTLLPNYHFRLIRFLKCQLKIAPPLTFCLLFTLTFQIFTLNQTFAQNVNTYDFAATTGTFTPLLAGTGPTVVPAIKANDAISAALPIGFTFNYAGGSYTSIYASSNGFLTFFGASPLPPTNITPLKTASTASMAIIAPLWADLNDTGAPGAAEASYQTTGAPGNRVFTFQWLNWKWGQVPVTNNQDISFQVKLYEGSDKIEFFYRQESINSNILNNLGSIGLAGPSTGVPDILSVFYPNTPHTSITSESTKNTRPPTGQIYTFTKSALKDIQAVELVYPTVTTCGANVPVSVSVKNMGAVTLDFSVTPLTVTGSITGPNPLPNPSVTINTGTLAINATMDVVFAPNYNMTAAGTYTFNATANLTGDGRPNNNTMPAANRTVTQIATVPQNVNFTGFNGNNLSTVFPGWVEETTNIPGHDGWEAVTGLGTANNITAIFTYRNNNVHSGWIKAPKVVVTASTELRFKAAITQSNSLLAHPTGMAGTDDKIYVMISTDCGTSFSPISTLDASNTAGITNVLTEQAPISLAAYAGQTVILGFYSTEGAIADPVSYNFHLDDISIATPPATDLGVTTITNPIATGCYTNAENVTVTIKNLGSSAIDFSANPAQVQAKVTVTGNPNPTMLPFPLTSGTLAPGATQTVNLPTLNMLAGGTYNFKVYTTITGDNNALNDTLTIVRTVAPTFALPNSVDFTGYTNSTTVAGFTALFPGWWSTRGATPDPNPLPGGAGWDAWNGVGQASNVTAIVNLSYIQEKSWLIGPKIVATPNTEFRFKAAITADGNINPYPLGMSGSDDKVQVMVSTNCGVSYSPFYTIDASNSGNITNNLSEIVVPLGSFAGQNIIIAIYGTDGTIDDANNYFFHLDDLVLRNVFATDIAPVKVITKRSGCGLTSTEQVCVVVKNEGVIAQSNIPVSFRVNNGTVVNGLIPGPIQPNDTLRYCFTGTADLAANGTYAIKVFSGLSNDANSANDTISHTVISYAPVALTSTSGDSRCGSGPVTLTATAPNNLPINWYIAATGGTAVGTGPTFTPTVSATTTYYAEAAAATEITGRLNSDGTTKSTAGRLYFNASQTFDLNSVVVYTDLGSGGNIVINLKNAANAVLQTRTFALPPVNGKTAITVPLNFTNITPGTGYSLELASGLTLFRDLSPAANPVFPITSPSQTVTITHNSASGYYNYFFNWTISVCSSSQRTPVVATVNQAPVVNLGSNNTICGTTPVTLDAGNAGSTFQWSMNGSPIAGATNQTFSATVPGNYSVSVTNATNCTAVGSVMVNSTTIATPTVTASGPLTICQGSSITLTGATATSGVTYQWHLNNAPITGATSATLNASAAGNYHVVASLSGCTSSSAPTAITVTPKPATPTVTLSGNTLTSGAVAGNQWYSVSGSTLTLIPGANLQTYTPTVPGNYTVVVTANGCESDAATAVNVLLGISKLEPGMKLEVYPNPTSGRFYVELTGFEKEASLQLISITGKVITNETVTIHSKEKATKALDLSGKAKGVYLLKVISGENVTIRKVVLD